jgi:hypothetical protein
LNIYVTYQMTDGEKGLSVKDVQLAYYGGNQTALDGSIDGSMRQYFSSDDDYQAMKDWIALGGDEATFAPIQAIIDMNCFACHNADYASANVELEDYEDVEALLVKDSGKPIPRLISLSHTHLMATLTLVFLLVFVFSFSSYPEWLKFALYMLAFFAIFLDIGSWWLAKLAPFFAVFVIIGGVLLGTSFGALSLLGLYDVWFGKKE